MLSLNFNNNNKEFQELLKLTKDSIKNSQPLTQNQIQNIRQEFSKTHSLSVDGEVFLQSLANKDNIAKLSASNFDPKSFSFNVSFNKNTNKSEFSNMAAFIKAFSEMGKDGLNNQESSTLKDIIKNMSGFSKDWSKRLMDSLTFYDVKELSKVITKIDSKVIEKGFALANSDPVLSNFSGEKKEVMKKFLQSYYTDPILLGGLKQEWDGMDLGYLSGANKNFTQFFTSGFNAGQGKDLGRFGSCQECQRRVYEIMQSIPDFNKYFDIDMKAQLGGMHNYILFKDQYNGHK
ncbi:MAG: hypothetical protein U0354_08975 [Candidatus Sericytochromatia bacterium]